MSFGVARLGADDFGTRRTNPGGLFND